MKKQKTLVRRNDGEEMLCPAHGLPIKVVTLEDGTREATCTCAVKPNKHLGLVVFSQAPEQAKE